MFRGESMKICYLSDAGSAHTRKWCSYFIKLGYEIHVISLNDGEIPGVKAGQESDRFEI